MRKHRGEYTGLCVLFPTEGLSVTFGAAQRNSKHTVHSYFPKQRKALDCLNN